MTLLARVSSEARRLLLAPPSPRVAIEVRGATLGAVKLSAGGRELETGALLEIPPGIVDVTSLEAPLVDAAAFGAEIGLLCEQTGISRGTRIAVVLPDATARFALIPRASLRGSAKEREDVVRFRLRKLLPYDSHAARVATSGPAQAEEILAAGVSQTALEALEHPFVERGLDPGLVELSGLALVRGLAPAQGDWLVVNWEPEYLSLLVVRDAAIVLTRTLSGIGIEDEGDVAREVANTILYHRERLGGRRLDGAFLRADETRAPHAARSLEPSLGFAPTLVAPSLAGASRPLPSPLAGAGACLLAETA